MGVAGVIITLGPHVSSGAPDKFKCAFFPIKVRDKVSTALIPAQHHGSGSTMQWVSSRHVVRFSERS